MLKRFIRKFRYGQKGFTLIELLVVIAILGVLAAVVVPNISKFINSGDLAAANTEVSSIQTAQAAYMADHNGTPATDQDDLRDYVTKDLIGSYVFDATTGAISSASYKDFTWDGEKFVR